MAAISAKAGLAGGGLQIGAVVDKVLNEKATIAGDIGYAFGNNYTVASLGASIKTPVRNNINLGLGLSYSSFSTGVTLSGPGNIASGGGVGVNIFADTMIKDNIRGQVGYDTRQGLLALVSFVVKK